MKTETMGVTAEGYVKACVLEQWSPESGGRLVLVAIAPQWYVAHKDTALCFLEIL